MIAPAVTAWLDVSGILAALLTTGAFVFQVWEGWRTRNVAGVSLRMYAVFSIGVLMWLVHGWILGSIFMVVANVCTLVLAGAVMVMRVAFGRSQQEGGGS